MRKQNLLNQLVIREPKKSGIELQLEQLKKDNFLLQSRIDNALKRNEFLESEILKFEKKNDQAFEFIQGIPKQFINIKN